MPDSLDRILAGYPRRDEEDETLTRVLSRYPKKDASGWETVTPILERRKRPDGSWEYRPKAKGPGLKAVTPVKTPGFLESLNDAAGEAISGIPARVKEGIASMPEILAIPMNALIPSGRQGRPQITDPSGVYGERGSLVREARESVREEREASRSRLAEKARGLPAPVSALLDTGSEAAAAIADPTNFLPFGAAAKVAHADDVARAALRQVPVPETAGQKILAKAMGGAASPPIVPPGPSGRAARASPEDGAELARLSLGIEAPPSPAAVRRPVRIEEGPSLGGQRVLLARGEDGEMVGRLVYDDAPGGGFTVHMAETEGRGTGAGRALYKAAAERSGPYRGSVIQTPEGEGFVARLRQTDPEIFTTGTKNAVTAAERAARNLPEVEVAARRTLGSAWDKAAQEIEIDPLRPRTLAREVAAKPRTLSAEDNALLLHDRMKIANDHRAILGEEEAALAAGDKAGAAAARVRRMGLEEAMAANDEAARKAGYEWGLAGRARQQLIREDYSPVRLITRARAAAAGKAVPQGVEEKLVATSRQLDEAMARLRAFEEGAQARNAQRVLAREAKKAAAETRKGGRRAATQDLASEFSLLAGEFRKVSATPRAGLDPDLAALVYKMAKNRVRAGATRLQEVVDPIYEAVKDAVDLEPSDIRDAIANGGAVKDPRAQSAAAARLSQVREEARLVGVLEAAEKGEPIPTRGGRHRRLTPPEIQALREKVEKVYQQHGLGRYSDEARLAALRTRLNRRLQELQGNNASPRTLRQLPPDPEVDRLRGEIKKLLAARPPRPRTPPSEAARMAALKKQLAKRIEAVRAELAGAPPAARRPLRTDPEIERLRSELKGLRQQLPPRPRPVLTDEQRLAALKKRLAAKVTELEGVKATGARPERVRRPPPVFDQEAIKLQAEVARLRREADETIRRVELANRSGLDKAIDWTVGWGRFIKLMSSRSLLRAPMSAATRVFLFNPIREVLGAPLTKLPGEAGRLFRERAPIEGGFSGDAIVKSWARFFSKDTRAASWGHLRRMEEDPLNLAHGGNAYMTDAPHDLEKIPRWMHLPGHINAALEDVPVRYASYELAVRKMEKFQRAMEEQGREILARGGDLTDPLEQLNAEARAFEWATRQVFMQDDPLVSAFRRGVARKPGDNALTKVGKGLLESQLPILKVPINILKERIDYATGLPVGIIRLRQAIKNGIDTLPYEEGDAIARQLKNGTFGLGLAWLGWAAADHIGGYYTGQKADVDEVGEGEIELFGVKIPQVWGADHPGLMQLHFFATLRKMADRYREGGLGRGAAAATLETGRNVPFLDLPYEALDALAQSRRGRDGTQRFVGGYLRGMTLPPDLQRLAKILDQYQDPETVDAILQQLGLQRTDHRKRRPDTLWEEYQTGVPGMRDDVQ